MTTDDLFLLGTGSAAPLTREELTRLFDGMRADGLAEALFYDGSVSRAEEFADLMREPGTWIYAVCGNAPGYLRRRDPLAFCWLNNFSGRGAMIHFCVTANGRERAEGIGRFVTRSLLLSRPRRAADRALLTVEGPAAVRLLSLAVTEPGPYCLDALFGLTPAPFRHALAFVRGLGFREKGRLPHALTIRRNGGERTVPGVLTCLTREDLPAGGELMVLPHGAAGAPITAAGERTRSMRL